MNAFTTESPSHSIESRLFRAFWNDGLLDLFFGVGALAVGAAWALGQVALGAIVPALLALFWQPLRRKIVEPRAGFVRFAHARVASSRRKLLASIGLGVGCLAVVAGIVLLLPRHGGGLVERSVAGLPAALVGVMAGLVAAGLRLVRFAGYGLLFLAAGLAVAQAGLAPEVALVAGGAAATLSGLAILVRFLRAADRVEPNG